jgi:hypothetical protein
MRGILIRLGKKLVKSRWLLVVILLTIFLIPNIALSSSISSGKVIELTNKLRIESGISPLNISPQLSAAAQDKAQDLVKRNYWSHETPEGYPFWIFADKQGYDWIYLGENLAADFKTPEGIVNAWFASPSHRKNILNKNYQDIGVGISDNIVVALYGTKNQLPVVNYLEKIPRLFLNFYLLLFNF